MGGRGRKSPPLRLEGRGRKIPFDHRPRKKSAMTFTLRGEGGRGTKRRETLMAPQLSTRQRKETIPSSAGWGTSKAPVASTKKKGGKSFVDEFSMSKS